MKRVGLKVVSVRVLQGQEQGLTPGDRILEVNGKAVRDELDYRFHAAGGPVTLKVVRLNEQGARIIQVRRGDVGGLSFEPMQPMRCRNRCIFCFIDQNPPGLRRTLYVKDEDTRFSFLYGNYVTLASMDDEQLDRICRMRFSPLYVSVHATDIGVRNHLLGRKKSRDILGTLEALVKNRIEIHTQIVLCPGINDGEILAKTIRDLAAFRPAVASIAIVPVGLTRFRGEKGLYPLTAISKRYSEKIINYISKIQKQIKVDYKVNFLHLSDEFYWKAQVPFPPFSTYNDLPQWENGVGMIPLFHEQWRKQRSRTARGISLKGVRFTAITGEMAYAYLLPYVRWVNRRFSAALNLVPVGNSFFGAGVKVTGLLVGQDIIRRFEGRIRKNSVLLIPAVMLDHEKKRFLDDLSVKDLEDELAVHVVHFRSDPVGFKETLKKNLKRFKTEN